MSALRRTGPDTDRRPHRLAGPARVLGFGACALLAGLLGCSGTEPRGEEAPAARANAWTPLPPPATDRIEYDTNTRTLTFYDLPDSGRWIVWLGGRMYPVGPDHRLPEGVDPDSTFVCYTVPGGHTSAQVSLSEIQAAREMHKSQPR